MSYSRYVWRNTSDTPDLYGIDIMAVFILIPDVLIKSSILFWLGVSVVFGGLILKHFYKLTIKRFLLRLKFKLNLFIWGEYLI